MVDQSVIDAVQSYLQVLRHNGMLVDFAVLYGSHARGNATEVSDIDVMVVSPLFDNDTNWNNVRRLWHATLNADVRIEPVGVGTRQWEEDDSMALINIARREGQIIHPAHGAVGFA
ncbi:MAG: nucleotidyltransferase domain-containing protein [Magnetococcus sp. YQC-5]